MDGVEQIERDDLGDVDLDNFRGVVPLPCSRTAKSIGPFAGRIAAVGQDAVDGPYAKGCVWSDKTRRRDSRGKLSFGCRLVGMDVFLEDSFRTFDSVCIQSFPFPAEGLLACNASTSPHSYRAEWKPDILRHT